MAKPQTPHPTVQIAVRLPARIVASLDRAVARANRPREAFRPTTRSDVVREALRRYLDTAPRGEQ